MLRNTLTSWNVKRLRFVLVLFFIALAVPTAILIKQAYSQLKWEAFHHYRLQAEELVTRIDSRYHEIIKTESDRTFTDYSFLNIAGDERSNFLQRSPLARFPVKSSVPGTIGYFQVDNNGKFSTPLLPSSAAINTGKAGDNQRYGISIKEKSRRQKVHNQIYQVLNQNRLISQPGIQISKQVAKNEPIAGVIAEEAESSLEIPAKDKQPRKSFEKMDMESVQAELNDEVTSQLAFDNLQSQKTYTPSAPQAYSKGLGRVEDLKLKKKYQLKTTKEKRSSEISPKNREKQKLSLRRERNVLPSPSSIIKENKKTVSKDAALNVSMFESEIDAFEFSILNSGHFVLYRKVWRNGHRYIQGLLIDPTKFIDGVIRKAFYETTVSNASNLAIAYQGNVLSALSSKSSRQLYSSAQELKGTLLLQNNLSAALGKLELIFSINELPAGPGGSIITWLSLILFLILSSGFYILYRLGLKQINLARQQQDFVSAISHELKTPLTSIRMYGEMLREGWTTEEKRKDYYDYIYEESERLTRLINNVLQLARMTRNELHVDLKSYTVAELIDTTKSKISSQVERANFILNMTCDPEVADKHIQADADYFIQIIINLVDNAIKFSSKSDTKQIDIQCSIKKPNKVQFTIRDYGPGIKKDQMRKIFSLFYRMENELTRETVGTGIGLSLVKQLTHAMHGEIDVINKEPGTEFQITFNSD